MTRQTYAAKVLTAEVGRHRARFTAVPSGEPDGFGVKRGLRFDKRTSRWLRPLLEVVDDPRIQTLGTDQGHLVVTFVSSVLADNRDPFHLADALVVLADRKV